MSWKTKEYFMEQIEWPDFVRYNQAIIIAITFDCDLRRETNVYLYENNCNIRYCRQWACLIVIKCRNMHTVNYNSINLFLFIISFWCWCLMSIRVIWVLDIGRLIFVSIYTVCEHLFRLFSLQAYWIMLINRYFKIKRTKPFFKNKKFSTAN